MLISFDEWKKSQPESNAAQEYFRRWHFNKKFFIPGQKVLEGKELPLEVIRIKKAKSDEKDYMYARK